MAARTCGFTETARKPDLSAELLRKATVVTLAEPNPSWVEDYLLSKMQVMADRVKSTIKVAFSSDTPACVRGRMEKEGEEEALRLVESAILKASQQQLKRLVISPELLKEAKPLFTQPGEHPDSGLS